MTGNADPRSPLGLLVDGASGLGKVGAAILTAAGVGLVYVVGGVVMAVRLWKVNLPVEQGVSVIPLEDLLIVGVRELILGAVAGFILLALASLRLALLAAAAVVLALVVPLTVGGLAWPASLLVLAVLARAVRKTRQPALWIAASTVALALAVTVLRYTDPPFRFPVARVVTTDTRVYECGSDAQNYEVCGAFLGATSDGVFVGVPSRSSFTFLPSDRLRALVLEPPPRSPPPRSSAFALALDAISDDLLPLRCTPLECWYDDHHLGSRIFR